MNQNNNLPPVRKPIQVSNAPEPITPVGNGSYRAPAKNAAALLIDWHHYWRLKRMEPWEAAALSLCVNPKEMQHHPQAWMCSGIVFTDASFPSRDVHDQFTKRLELLTDNIYDRAHFAKHDGTLSLSELARWCAHVGYDNLPPELVAAMPAPITVSEQTPATPAPAESVEQRRARYLDWFNEETRIIKRGALQRVVEREAKQNPKADRSNISKDIKKAQDTAKTQKQANTWTSQLVTDGKRKG